MRSYRRTQSTQADVNAYVAQMAQQLEGFSMKVTPNGYGHRVECTVCGWSKCHDTVTVAKAHAANH